jgi:hypothetical protein
MALDVRQESSRPAKAIGVVIVIAAAAGIPIWVLWPQHTATGTAATAAPVAGAATPTSGTGAPAQSGTSAPGGIGARTGGRALGTGRVARANGPEAAALPVKSVDADNSPGARIGALPDTTPAPKNSNTPTVVMIVKPIYDAKDTDVTPPTLLTPLAYAPLAPGTRVEDVGGAVQIVVNENGTVDSVKATVSPKTIGETILMTSGLSIAKAWRFDPAVKDGRPVRYSLIVPLSRMFRESPVSGRR